MKKAGRLELCQFLARAIDPHLSAELNAQRMMSALDSETHSHAILLMDMEHLELGVWIGTPAKSRPRDWLQPAFEHQLEHANSPPP